MPRLTTPNSLYKFMTNKLCHPMRIFVENYFFHYDNDWYGNPNAKHMYCIVKLENKIKIRYENDYWNQEVINKYGKNS